MTNQYYQTIKSLEEQGVSREYINGWACGFLGNPIREEQRLNEPYQAGYDDGSDKNTDNAANWKQ